MNPKEAADKLRPDFHLAQMPPEDRHHVKFVEDVAGELGVEPTPFNLQQVAHALDAADIHGDDHHFPMMFYSRQHHAVGGIAASTYYPRHDMTGVIVENEDQFKALGDGWVENPADLPPRGEPGSDGFIPIAAPPPAKKDLPEPDAAAEMARRATLQQAATESLTETANLGRGTAVDGTTTRRNPDGLQADTSQPGNIRQVKNELS